MSDQITNNEKKGVSRRNFLLSTAAAGAGMMAAPNVLSAAARSGEDQLNVAIIGCGAQGRVLLDSCLRIPGIRFKALCDIWEYSQVYTSGILEKYGQKVNIYEDYQEMLEKEQDLDAAIVATPDWVHAEHAIACMEAGLDVYCEKEMSNNLEDARRMVEAKNRTGKTLQIGHQRRSNPRYLHAVNKVIHDAGLLGRVTHANAQWNRRVTKDLTWPEKYEMSEEKLGKYGYASMHEFRNWRWYKKYGGGPIVDLGSHQIDIFAWVFQNNPTSVIADGGIDYYDQHEWYDNVMCIYEYESPQGTARAFYQTLTTTANGLFYETFMGVNGSLQISEVPQSGNHVLREPIAPEWEPYAREGLIEMPVQETVKPKKDTFVDVRASKPLGSWPLPIELAKPAHQPHLENFFDAIRLDIPLNCPAEIGYETAVAVLAVNKAVAKGEKLRFRPEDFHA